MEQYAAVLLWAIPSFLILIIIEIAYGHFTNKQTYTFMDTLASLSSGMTNTLKDALGLVFPSPTLRRLRDENFIFPCST